MLNEGVCRNPEPESPEKTTKHEEEKGGGRRRKWGFRLLRHASRRKLPKISLPPCRAGMPPSPQLPADARLASIAINSSPPRCNRHTHTRGQNAAAT